MNFQLTLYILKNIPPMINDADNVFNDIIIIAIDSTLINCLLLLKILFLLNCAFLVVDTFLGPYIIHCLN